MFKLTQLLDGSVIEINEERIKTVVTNDRALHGKGSKIYIFSGKWFSVKETPEDTPEIVKGLYKYPGFGIWIWDTSLEAVESRNTGDKIFYVGGLSGILLSREK